MQDGLCFDKPLVLKIHAFGRDFEVRKPAIGEQTEYEKRVKSCKDDSEVIETILNYLHSLGFEKEYAAKLHLSQIRQVMTGLTESDKKK